MMLKVEVGELCARVNGERVSLVVHADQGGNVELQLSPLAANNLALQLPDLAQEAAAATIRNIFSEGGPSPWDLL